MKTNVERAVPARVADRRVAGFTIWTVLAMLLVTVSPAGAHPEAVLESDRASVEAGGSIALRGAEFGPDETYALRLLGALAEYDLGEAKSDGEGVFHLDLTVPGDVRPGAYQIVAIAPDGDVSARLDLNVSAALPMNAGDLMDMDDAGMEARQATADEISIERDRSGIEWAAIGLIIGAAGGLGIGLRRRPRG